MWDWVSFCTVIFLPIVSVANFKEEAEKYLCCTALVGLHAKIGNTLCHVI
jgi:hypothetical protein